jgi:nucleotide-binding universal stress UspA family protein
MKTERILLPLDIRKCPLGVFSVVNGLAKQSAVTVTLLHVVNLSVAAPENRVYEQLGREARWHLGRLARGCLRPGFTIVTRVRFGKPAEEILAEAVDGNADMIVLASGPPSFWSHLVARLVPRVVGGVIRRACCGVFLTTVKKWFNCENAWGRPEKETEVAADQLNEASETGVLPLPLGEDVFASRREQRRAAAWPLQAAN